MAFLSPTRSPEGTLETCHKLDAGALPMLFFLALALALTLTCGPGAAVLPTPSGRMAPGRRAPDVARIRTAYSTIVIFDDGPYRCLAFNTRAGVQSCVHRRRPLDFRSEYARLMFAASALVASPQRVLVLGLGGAALPRLVAAVYPGAKIDAVEIDAGVFRAAKRYLGYRPSARTRVFIEDAARFVTRHLGRRTYDVIYVDCFDGKHIPKHLLSREFVRSLRGLLAPGGVVAANFWSSHPSYPRSVKRYRRVFSSLWLLKGVRDGNHIVIGTQRPVRERLHQIVARTARLEKRLRPPFVLSVLLGRLVRLK